ncbi:putative holin [Mycobacteroides abscessus]|uniref:putative holin n=1 Tax=Mycobacteroides abscessus TaxID=36809 RepID=UPI00092CBB14|nr:putative holin [Mycobacteroides abscessus]SIC47525.1 hydrophobic protein [Mycobacteroides abscessus subsp. abscessus]
MIPLPRAQVVASAMLLGIAVGLGAGMSSILVAHEAVRPDLVIGLIVAVPSLLGFLILIASTRKWMTTAAAFILAISPGWFGMLAAILVIRGV